MRAIYSLLIVLPIGYGTCACSDQEISKLERCGWGNGIDGSALGRTCWGSPFGSCCSKFGWWYVIIVIVHVISLIRTSSTGNSYCGAGCQPDYGWCYGYPTPPSKCPPPVPAPVPPPVLPPMISSSKVGLSSTISLVSLLSST
jgi:hypothetical protein